MSSFLAVKQVFLLESKPVVGVLILGLLFTPFECFPFEIQAFQPRNSPKTSDTGLNKLSTEVFIVGILYLRTDWISVTRNQVGLYPTGIIRNV